MLLLFIIFLSQYPVGCILQETLPVLEKKYFELENFYNENKNILEANTNITRTPAEDLEYRILVGGKTWVQLQNSLKQIINKCIASEFQNRPSLQQLLCFFTYLLPKEAIL